jgi:hypothetical protein
VALVETKFLLAASEACSPLAVVILEPRPLLLYGAMLAVDPGRMRIQRAL